MKKEIALVCMLFVGVISFGQTLKLDWSEDLQYDKKEGFLDEIIGTNENKIFTIFNIAKPGITTTELTIKKIQLVAFDKKSLKKTQSVTVMGYPSNKESDKNLKGLEYFKTVFTKNSIYIFWHTKEFADIGKRELFVQTFDLNLKPTNQLKKIFEVKEPKKVQLPPIFFVTNTSSQDKFVVGYELPGVENELRSTSFSYLNSDLTLGKTYKYIFSYKIFKGVHLIRSRFGKYYLYDNDMIQISVLSDDVFINLKDGKQKANSNILPEELSVISSITKKEGILMKNYGIYSDKESFGIYYYTQNVEDFSISKIEKIPFSKEQTELLISNYKNDLNKLAKSQRFSTDKTKDITKNYEIEKIIEDSSGIYLITSRNYNYYMAENQNHTYVNVYYSDKGTIAIIPLINNKIGNITTIDRKITYRDKYRGNDVSCIKSKNQLYIIYGSDFNAEKSNVQFHTAKYYYKMAFVDKLAYSIYDFKNKTVSNKSIIINDEKSDEIQKYVAPAKFISYNSNEYLINSNNMYNGFGIRKKKGKGNIGILRVE